MDEQKVRAHRERRLFCVVSPLFKHHPSAVSSIDNEVNLFSDYVLTPVPFANTLDSDETPSNSVSHPNLSNLSLIYLHLIISSESVAFKK